jgi:excinuclease ABC subunit A
MVDKIAQFGGDVLAPADWNERGVVKIEPAEPGASLGVPFFQATTSAEWIVTLRFRVPRRTFSEKALQKKLGLVPFTDGSTPVLSDAPRLQVAELPGFQEIAITGHGLDEFQTQAFDEFLQLAVAAHKHRDDPARPNRKLKRAVDL